MPCRWSRAAASGHAAEASRRLAVQLGRALALLSLLFSVLAFRPACTQTAPAETTHPPAESATEVPGESPAICRIGVNVEDLYDLDMARDTFGAILWVWSLCPSADLAPLATIAFPTTSGSLSLSPIEVEDVPSGGQYASRRVQGTFRYDWDMDHYPFDRQRVVIPIDEAQYGAARLTFEADGDASFLSPELRERLAGWTVSDLALEASVSHETSSYGLPGMRGADYARIEAAIDLQRANLVAFLKLTAGVFAGALFVFISIFFDPNDRAAFGGRLGLLVGVLFAILLNLRSADASIGDSGELTLVTWIHLLTLALAVVMALVALRDHRALERGLPLRHPDWPTLALLGGLYTLAVAALIARAAWS
jgi:hypothetical protein